MELSFFCATSNHQNNKRSPEEKKEAERNAKND